MFILFDQFPGKFDQFFRFESWQTNSSGRLVHTGHVLIRTEHGDSILRSSVGFQTFK